MESPEEKSRRSPAVAQVSYAVRFAQRTKFNIEESRSR